MKKWFTEYKSALKMLEVEEIFDLIFYRPLAFLLVKIIYPTNITPNQLTVAAVFLGLIGGIFYGFGKPEYFCLAGILFILYDVFDCSDGQLARLKKNGTKLGRILDGLADYIATIAAYIGIGIGLTKFTGDSLFSWGLTVGAGITSAILSILLDFYRNRFLDVVLRRESILETELEEFKAENERLKNVDGKTFEKWVIKIYLKYSEFQVNMASNKKTSDIEKDVNLTKINPELFYKKNKKIIHLWTYLGPTTQLTFMIICSFLSRLDIYLMGMIVFGNLFALILFVLQKQIDNQLKKIQLEQV